MSPDTTMQTAEEINRINRRKYEEDYSIEQVSIAPNQPGEDYFRKLTRIRLGLVGEYGRNGRVLDVGCGSGDYLFACKEVIGEGIGIDFSNRTINEALYKRNKQNVCNINFLVCNAAAIPLATGTFDLIYSFSALYCMPRIEHVIGEIGRLLKSTAMAVLELGNLTSLNTIVSRAYPEWAIPCHIRTGDMKRFIRNAGLKVVQRRVFQILPLWGDRPHWLWPLLNWRWKRLLQTDVRGKMLDERIASLPLLRNFAFRHIFVCRKQG